MVQLSGKAIVITGSGRGIGAACAHAAARLGAAVVVNDVDRDLAGEVANDIRKTGGTAVAHAADITSWSEAAGLVERCVREFGAIDGLVNNAGLFRMGRIEETDEAELRALVDVNILGTAFCAVSAVRHMLRQGHGSIVNVSSGAHFGLPAMGAYAATKGAVASFTYSWAAELKDTRIRVNALSPMGATRMAQLSDEYHAAHNVAPRRRTQPPPEANAPVVCYLLSDDAAGVHGQIVRIEGTRLSLVVHPGVLLPALERETWTVDDVAEAFRTDLAKRQLPVGVVGLNVEAVDVTAASYRPPGI